MGYPLSILLSSEIMTTVVAGFSRSLLEFQGALMPHSYLWRTRAGITNKQNNPRALINCWFERPYHQNHQSCFTQGRHFNSWELPDVNKSLELLSGKSSFNPDKQQSTGSGITARMQTMNIRHKTTSRISREYTKMTTGGIRTHARKEPRTYKALKSRQYLSGGKTLNHSPLQSRVRSGNSHICVNAFKPPTASCLLIPACIN